MMPIVGIMYEGGVGVVIVVVVVCGGYYMASATVTQNAHSLSLERYLITTFVFVYKKLI